jgi:predicted protein tyrosine phosphatase
MKITISARIECPVAHSKYRADHILSIQEPEDKGVKLITPAGIKSHNHFFFHDVERMEDSWDDIFPPTEEMVAEVLSWAKGLPQDEHLFIHCYAGVSRSPGLGFAIICQELGAGNECEALFTTFKSAPYGGIWPNSLIVEYADKILDRGGEMVNLIKEFKDNDGRIGALSSFPKY